MILDMIARLSELTEVDGLIAPLRRTRRLDKRDSKLARGRFDCIDCLSLYNASGLIFIPWNHTNPSRLRLTKNISLDNFGFKPLRNPCPCRHVAFHNQQSSLSIFVIRHLRFPLANGVQICRIPKITDRS